MPSTDRASTLRDVLTRLYPNDDALGHLNQQSPGLYDRLIGGKDDATAFHDLEGVFPNFAGELTRYIGREDAEPVWGGLRGFDVAGGPSIDAPAVPSDVTGYDPGAFGAFIGALGAGIGNPATPVSGLATMLNGMPAVQSFMTGAFPLTNGAGESVYGTNPVGDTAGGTLVSSLLGFVPGLGTVAQGAMGAPTIFSTAGQLADAFTGDIGGGPITGGASAIAPWGGALSGADASLAAGAEFGDTGEGVGFGSVGSAHGMDGLGGGAIGRTPKPSLIRGLPQFFGSDTDYNVYAQPATSDPLYSAMASSTPGFDARAPWSLQGWPGYQDWLDKYRYGGKTLLSRFGSYKGSGGDASGSTGDSSGAGGSASGW